MADRYEALRWAIDHHAGPGNSIPINRSDAAALLAERDKFFFALQEISHPEAVRGDATKIARAALSQ